MAANLLPRNFSRPAQWLRTIFPPSTTPGGRDPGSVSEHVQLVQTYADGIAYTSLQNDYLFKTNVNNPGPGNTVQILDNPSETEFHRIVNISGNANTVPTANTSAQLFVRRNSDNLFVTVSDFIVFTAAVANVRFVWPMEKSPLGLVLPPDHELVLRQGAAGDAASTFTIDVGLIRLIVPVGGTIYF